MNLDDAQREAVEAGAGALCIIAPPGSGKTHTLVERIKHLVSIHGIAPSSILAITFTNKAAREMRERLERSISGNVPHCATFHALAHDIVRTHGSLAGIPADFTLVEDEKEKIAGALTFDELLSHALALLEEYADVRSHWQGRFEHILVDEYQDTDDRQDRMITLLAEPHGRICVIGDPNQAIYGFRGANVANFLTFGERYPDARKVALKTNYRSRPLLVRAAHGLMEGECPHAHRSETGERIVLKESPSAASEAHWIVTQVEKLIGGTDHGGSESEYQPGDIAILYRFNAIGKQLEKAFAEAGIPHVLVTEANLDEIEFDTFRVPLMTMHAAKGLEFPVVFIAGLEDGVMPYLKEDSDIAEEKRLLYVAMTRAKDRLFLSYSKKRPLFGKTFSEPSRFLRNISPEYISVEARKPPKAYQKKLF